MAINISNTDAQKIIKYLNDAALVYDNMQGQRYSCRAWVIRRTTRKLLKKLPTTN